MRRSRAGVKAMLATGTLSGRWCARALIGGRHVLVVGVGIVASISILRSPFWPPCFDDGSIVGGRIDPVVGEITET